MASRSSEMSFWRIVLWCALLAAMLATYFFISDANTSERVGSSLDREILSPEEIAFAEQTKLEDKVFARIDLIRSETAALKDHPWAGEYSGIAFMALSPKTGLATMNGGCFGMYGAKTGSVRQNEKGWLEFSFEQDKKKRFVSFDAAMLPVRWGNRRYLIPEEQLEGFTEAINFGDEPRDRIDGSFLLIRGDEHKPVTGLPDLPAEYLKKIRDHAIEAKITKGEHTQDYPGDYGCNRQYRVTLDKGIRDGLSVGDSLRLVFPENEFDRLYLDQVEKNAASGVATVRVENCADDSQTPDKRWRYTTGAYIEK